MPIPHLTATQLLNSLSPEQRRQLLLFFKEAYDDGYRPHMHRPDAVETIRNKIDSVDFTR